MRNKTSTIVISLLAGLVVLGSVGYAVWDSCKSRQLATSYKTAAQRHAAALAAAKANAREKIRDELRRQEKDLAKREGNEAVLAQRELAKKRRTAMRNKFFGSGGFKLTAEYAKAVEMPAEDPTAEDQEIIDLAGEMMSETDLDTAAEVTEAALKSQDPRARLAAVEMLSALGDVGLADLGEFLTDPHPEVANLAADRWELGVQDILDDAKRTALVKVGLLAITDEDQLRSMVGTLLLTSDDLLVIQTVADVMRDGEKVQREAVKSAYETLTGEDWKGEDAAEKWLQENYTPPEPEEPTTDEDSSEDSSDSDTDA